MSKSRCLAVLAVLALALIPAVASASSSTVVIHNASSYAIAQLFMSPADEAKWGPDQLQEHIIAAEGGTFELKSIPCDTYDVKVVDEDGDECILPGVDICSGDAEGWVVSDEDLLACEGYGGGEE